jgi:DNA-binding PadR family transcriptional regulator
MKFHHHDRDDDFDHPHRRWHKWLRRRHGAGMFEAMSEHRARRGDVKFIILAALNERPMHGYDIMGWLEEQHGGGYRPSPGSVYPTLQMLEDGGFVTSEHVDGKRVYTITAQGKELLAERGAQTPEAEESDSRDEWTSIRDSARRFLAAAKQGIVHEDPRVRKQVRDIVDDARKRIYKILAEER